MMADQDVAEVLPLADVNRPADNMQCTGVSSWTALGGKRERFNGKELLQVS